MNKKSFYTFLFVLFVIGFWYQWVWYVALWFAISSLIGLGTFLAFVIDVVTAGRGKDIASWIAYKRGFADCGCKQRKEYLDSLTKIELKEIIKL